MLQQPQWIPSPPASPACQKPCLRVDAEKIDSVLNLVGELIIAKSMLHQAINEFDKTSSQRSLEDALL